MSLQLEAPGSGLFNGNAQVLYERRWLVTDTSCIQKEISMWYSTQLTEAIHRICLEESDSKRNRGLTLNHSPYHGLAISVGHMHCVSILTK